MHDQNSNNVIPLTFNFESLFFLISWFFIPRWSAHTWRRGSTPFYPSMSICCKSEFALLSESHYQYERMISGIMSTKHAFFYIIFKLLIKHLSQPEFNLCCQWLYAFPEQNIYIERWPFLLSSFFLCIDDVPAGV